MIGQFIVNAGTPDAITVALDERGRWHCDDPHTLRMVKALHPFDHDRDSSPSRGGVKGGALLAEAAKTFDAGLPYYFIRQAAAVPGQTD